MKNLLKKIYNVSDKIPNIAFLIIFNLLKALFWLVFGCLFLLQAIILLNLWYDLPIETNDALKAIILYMICTVCFIIGLFVRKKILVYASAFGVIILFLYLSSLPSLSLYFDYFNGLD